ncbi:MAG: ABC transporter permease [Anaerolineae bacterium]|nr:ABC transporter permease [Anaerolineae bacterium]
MASRIALRQQRYQSTATVFFPLPALRSVSLRLKVAVGLLLLIGLAAFVLPNLTPCDPAAINPSERMLPPSHEHPLGTDMFGRDMFSRVMYGARPTFEVAIGAVLIGAVPGVALGLVAGSKRSLFDQIFTQVVDAWIALPGVLVALVLAAAMGRSLFVLALALGISSIPLFYRVIRAETMRISSEPYVEAATSLGADRKAILLRHVFPNVAPSLLSLVTISIGRMLLATSALSFIGLGAPPPSPEWGSLLAEGRAYMETSWWLIWYPGVAIALTTFAIFLFGNALRDHHGCSA